MKLSTSVFIVIALSSCLLYSCYKQEIVMGPAPAISNNPYDKVVYPSGIVSEPTVDSFSFVGLHKYIFGASCASSGCHDGPFEPDFRTVQSIYQSLVYHPVKKNNAQGSFTYRVKPGDTTLSWLHERITTDDAVLGRMPLYKEMLSRRQILMINNWIMDGAKDIFGHSAIIPNYEPATFGLVATIPFGANPAYRVDTVRNGNPFFPFLVTNNTALTIWFGLSDDVQIPYQFTYNKIKFSANPVDFSSAITLNLTVNTTPTFLDNFFAIHQPYFHHITLNTGTLPNNQIIYCRIYVQDADHSSPTEIPKADSQSYLQSYFSFIVSP